MGGGGFERCAEGWESGDGMLVIKCSFVSVCACLCVCV